MRNLKRALSLAMASVMLLGMMVVGTSAKGLDDFKDASEIVNQDAVAVTSYIGVFDGYEDGEFKPENVVTRAEMAVIISKILYGGDVNVDQFKDQKLFTDVPDWAEGYVNLCASLGIVAGYGDGKFGPSDTVTTAQAAMMLTKALGYFQNAKDYGDNWILAATAKATSLGMYGDLQLSATAGLTRDAVAEMVFNTLTKAVTVEYNDTFAMYYTTGSDWTAGVEFNYRQTLGYKQFKLVYESDDKDDFGRPCTIWGTGSLKAGDIDADGNIEDDYDGIDAADEIISAPNDSKATFTAKITSKTLYNTLGSTAAKDYSWNIYVDGEELSNAAVKDIKASVLNNKSENDAEFAAKAGEAQLTGNGVLTEIYTDSDAKEVDIIVINTYVAEVLKVEKGYITLSALSGDADTDDEFEVTGYDEDDIVLYTYADGDIQSVAPATKLEGEVDRVRMNTSDGGYEGDNDSFTVDGTVYKYTFKQGFEGTKLTADNVDNNVVAYLDPYGYVIYVDESASTYDYAYVLTVGSESGKYDSNPDKATAYARLILTDGTLVKAELEDNYAKSKDLLHHLVSYTVDKDGVYTLTDKSKAAAAATSDTIVENGKASVKGLGGTVVANSDTVFILVDSDDNDYDDYDISVYTGIKNVPDVDKDKDTIGTYATKSDSTVAKVVYIQDGDVGGSGDVILAIANPSAKLNKGGDEGDYYEIDAVVDGAKTTLMVKGSSSAADKLVKKIDTYTTVNETAANGAALGTTKRVVALKSITKNSDDLVTSVTLYDEKYAKDDGILVAEGTLKAEDGTVGIGGTRYAYDDEVVVARYTVDDKAVKVSRISAVKQDKNDIVLAVMDDSVVTGIFIIEKDDAEGTTPVKPSAYTVTVKVNDTAVKTEEVAVDAAFTYTHEIPEGNELVSVTGANYTVDGQKVTVKLDKVTADATITITTKEKVDTFTLTLSADKLISAANGDHKIAKVYAGDGSGDALVPEIISSFGSVISMKYTVVKNTVLTIVDGDLSGGMKTVVMTEDVTITEDDVDVEAGTKFTITVDGEVVDTVAAGGTTITDLTPNGWYIIDGSIGKQANADGKMSLSDTSKNRELVSAGEITITGSNATATYAADAVKVTISGKDIVANGEEITLNITGTVKITANGTAEVVDVTGPKTITVNGDVKVEDWETQEDFEEKVADEIDGIGKKDDPTGVEITNTGDEITIKITADYNTAGNVKNTGIFDAVNALINTNHYQISVKAPDGYTYNLKGTAADVQTAKNILPANGAEGEYVVTISSAKADAPVVINVTISVEY